MFLSLQGFSAVSDATDPPRREPVVTVTSPPHSEPVTAPKLAQLIIRSQRGGFVPTGRTPYLKTPHLPQHSSTTDKRGNKPQPSDARSTSQRLRSRDHPPKFCEGAPYSPDEGPFPIAPPRSPKHTPVGKNMPPPPTNH
jgi:hypothetical protein